MKLSLSLILVYLCFSSYGQSYINGPKFQVYKKVSTDMDENVKSTLDVKNVTIEINSKSKVIIIRSPNNYFEKYFYYEYNKNVVLKGKYYDWFTINKRVL